VYGLTKLAGEQSIQKVGGKYLIFRASWVYGRHGKNFLLTMLRLGGSATGSTSSMTRSARRLHHLNSPTLPARSCSATH
jgi:nucleoside-diphosphate-sugar epimerase